MITNLQRERLEAIEGVYLRLLETGRQNIAELNSDAPEAAVSYLSTLAEELTDAIAEFREPAPGVGLRVVAGD